MREKLAKRTDRPVSVNLNSYYDFSSILVYRGALTQLYSLDAVPNLRRLIPRWDRVHSSDFEFLYYKSIVDDTDTPFDNYPYKPAPTLIAFFLSQMIDIPVCLKKIKYAHSSSASVPKLRLITMLLRHGKRQTISKLYSKVAAKLSYSYFMSQSCMRHTHQWDFIYLLFAQRKARTRVKGYFLSRPLRFPNKFELFNLRGELFNSSKRFTSDYD